MSEANYFFSQRMREKKKKFIVVNLDLDVSEMPALMQDYLFIDMRSPNSAQKIIDAIIHEQKSL